MTTTRETGFYATDSEVYYVTPGGRAWIVASPDIDGIEEIEAADIPADATDCEDLLTGQEQADYLRQIEEESGEKLIETTDTWCVCGQESGNDPWEPVEDGFASEDEAREYLRARHHDHPEFSGWYIDREDNDGHAEAYFERNPDGSLAEWQGSQKVGFAD